MHPLQAEARALKLRMRNPPNGRHSTELDVVSETEMRRRRLEQAKQIREVHTATLDAQRRAQIEEMIRNAVADHARAKAIAQKLAEEPEPEPRPPSIADIIRAVCAYFNVTPLDLYSQRRTANVVLPRQVAMYLGRVLTTCSLPMIARRIGRRDHTTALHSYNKIKSKIEFDPDFAAEIEVIKQSI